MGVMIFLDIMPNHIEDAEWEKVYEETLELIHAYPFLNRVFDDTTTENRKSLDFLFLFWRDIIFRQGINKPILSNIKCTSAYFRPNFELCLTPLTTPYYTN